MISSLQHPASCPPLGLVNSSVLPSQSVLTPPMSTANVLSPSYIVPPTTAVLPPTSMYMPPSSVLPPPTSSIAETATTYTTIPEQLVPQQLMSHHTQQHLMSQPQADCLLQNAQAYQHVGFQPQSQTSLLIQPSQQQPLIPAPQQPAVPHAYPQQTVPIQPQQYQQQQVQEGTISQATFQQPSAAQPFVQNVQLTDQQQLLATQPVIAQQPMPLQQFNQQLVQQPPVASQPQPVQPVYQQPPPQQLYTAGNAELQQNITYASSMQPVNSPLTSQQQRASDTILSKLVGQTPAHNAEG